MRITRNMYFRPLPMLVLALCFLGSTVGAGYHACAEDTPPQAMQEMECCPPDTAPVHKAEKRCCLEFSCPRCFSFPVVSLQPMTASPEAHAFLPIRYIGYAVADYIPSLRDRPPKA